MSVVDVLVEMQSLTPAHLQDWRSERAYATHWVSRRDRSPRPADATGEEASAEARIGHEKAEERAASPEPTRNIVQPGVRIERDPDRVRQLAEEKRHANVSLERLKAKLQERGIDWRADPGGCFRQQ